LYLHREAYLSICVGDRERASVGDLPAPVMEDSMSIEEQAGALLEAEVAHDLSLLRHHYEDVHRAT
jgi:hypothetical protein